MFSKFDLSGRKNLKSADKLFILLILIFIGYGLHVRNVTISQTVVDGPIRADAFDYYNYSQNLSSYHIFSRQSAQQLETQPITPDALRSPGFPFFASFFYSKDPGLTIQRTLSAQTIVQIVSFLLFTVFLIFTLGLRWSTPAIFLLWSFPHFASINTYYLSESIFTSFLTLIVFTTWLFDKRIPCPRVGAVIVGLLIGVTTLIRPTIEYFPLFLVLFTLLFNRKNLKNTIILSFAALVPIILWKIRNLLSIGQLSDPTLMINGLYHGSFPNFMYNNDPDSFGFPYRFDPRANEVYEGVGATLSIIFERFLKSPLEYIHWYAIGKQQYLWQWGIISGQGDIFIYPTIESPYYNLPDLKFTHLLNKIFHIAWIPIGLISTFVVLARARIFPNTLNKSILILALIAGYSVLIHVLVAPFPRYGIPFKIFLIPLSIILIKEATEWLLKKSARKLL